MFCVGNISIEGYTDNVGDPRFNQRLSEERAAAVRELLKLGLTVAGLPEGPFSRALRRFLRV